jgi:ribosomal protein L37AE/L43A
MVLRKCPHCKKPSYSANESGKWKCLYCGNTLGKELNETPTETREPHGRQV